MNATILDHTVKDSFVVIFFFFVGIHMLTEISSKALAENEIQSSDTSTVLILCAFINCVQIV